MSVRCDRAQAWAALSGHYQAHGRDLDLREAFARDPARAARFGFEAPEVFADLSKNLIDEAGLRFLLELAHECGIEPRRDAMLGGAQINATEGRAVLHSALRAPRPTPPRIARHRLAGTRTATGRDDPAAAAAGTAPW